MCTQTLDSNKLYMIYFFSYTDRDFWNIEILEVYGNGIMCVCVCVHGDGG